MFSIFEIHLITEYGLLSILDYNTVLAELSKIMAAKL
jgi:hypothetical protein